MSHKACVRALRRSQFHSISTASAPARQASPPGPRRPPRTGPRAPLQHGAHVSKKSKPPRPEYDTADAIFKARRIPLLATGVIALGCGLYFTMMVSSFLQAGKEVDDGGPTGRPPGFTRDSAQQFDRSLDASEKTMGVTALREKLGRMAAGHVLEVALGTGRNMRFYDWSTISGSPEQSRETNPHPRPGVLQPMKSFTGVDVSSDMLGVALEKLPDAAPCLAGVAPQASTASSPADGGSWTMSSFLGGKVRIARGDIQESLPPLEPSLGPAAKYDTVVQTFGLCSVTNPERVLLNLVDAVQPGTGRIILIEHGQSWWGIVNTLLDWSAPSHFRKYGCWWNRDIVGIIDEAVKRAPKLEVVRIERPYLTQLGTTVWVELQVARQTPSQQCV